MRRAEVKVWQGVYVDNSATHLCVMSVEKIGNKGIWNTETEEQLITGENGTPEILDIRKEIKKQHGEEGE